MCTQAQLDKITNEVTQGAKKILGDKLRKVILYGSYARGDYDNESDIDIMVLADVRDEEISILEREIDLVSGDVSLENGLTVCAMLYDKNFFEERIAISPFYRNVVNDGVSLYAI